MGTKLVKYDIFGENVLIASKMKVNTPVGSMCISQETMNLLSLNAKISKTYDYEELNTFKINKRMMKKFKVTLASNEETDSDAESVDDSSH